MPARRPSRFAPNRLPPRPPVRQHPAHTPSLRDSAPRESSLERVRRIAREHDKPFDPTKRGTWQGSSRDLVVNPSKRFKRAVDGRIENEHIDSPDALCPEHGCAKWRCNAEHEPENSDEFLVIEEDRGNGTLEWVLVNPLEFPGSHSSDYQNLFAFGFGAYGATRLLVWGGGDIEDALTDATGWLEQYAPGHLSSEDQVALLMDEVREEDPDLSEEEAYEQATADLTYTEAGYLTSYEWTVDDVRKGTPLYQASFEASQEEFEREYPEA